MRSCKRLAAALAAGMLLHVLGGCAKEITITRYPPFWTPELRSVAVLPFKHTDRQVGDTIADQFANGLRSTNTYRVFNPAEVADLARMQDIQIAFGDDQVAMAAQLRKISGLNVQAILVGRVTAYSATQRNERRREPVMVFNPSTGTMVPSGQYNTYTLTRNEGSVGVTAALIRVKDGSTIHAMAQPVQWMQWAQGSPPPMDQENCRSVAVRNVVGQLVEEFAVVRQRIKIKPEDTLRIARDFYDGEWQQTDRFRTGDKQILVALSLPPVCDRNNFRITIIRKDQREDLAEVNILWSRQFPAYGKGYTFSPAEIAAKGGPGQFTVKLYSGMDPKPILTQDFTIQP